MRIPFLSSGFSQKVESILTVIGGALILGSCSGSGAGAPAFLGPSNVSSVGQGLSTGPVDGLIGAYLEGTYSAACVAHTTQQVWSAKVSDYAGSISATAGTVPLQVVADNTTCELFLQDVVFDNGSGTKVTYVVASPLQIGDSYAATPVGFFTQGFAPGADAQFFGNIRLDQPPTGRFNYNPEFDNGGFGMDFVYSPDPNLVSVTNGPIVFFQVTPIGITDDANVNPPDYATGTPIDFGTDGFTVGLDANAFVVDVSGGMLLKYTSNPGEDWVYAPLGIGHQVSTSPVAFTYPGDATNYNDVQDTYNLIAGTPGAEMMISANPFEVEASQIGFVVGEQITGPVSVTIIIKHTSNSDSGSISAYEVVVVTYNPPVTHVT